MVRISLRSAAIAGRTERGRRGLMAAARLAVVVFFVLMGQQARLAPSFLEPSTSKTEFQHHIVTTTQSAHSSAFTTTREAVSSSFPAACTAEQLQTIQYQLPEYQFQKFAGRKKKVTYKCSFSYATQCPDTPWVTEYFAQHTKQRPTAVYIGCNKDFPSSIFGRTRRPLRWEFRVR